MFIIDTLLHVHFDGGQLLAKRLRHLRLGPDGGHSMHDLRCLAVCMELARGQLLLERGLLLRLRLDLGLQRLQQLAMVVEVVQLRLHPLQLFRQC